MPRLGITTRPLEKGVSGSGMHLDRLLRAFVKLNHGLELCFLRHTDKPSDLYQYGTTCQISRNPVVAARQVAGLKLDILHFTPLSIFSPMFAPARFRCATLHPDDELIIPECYPWHRRMHSRHLVGAYARRLDRVFTVSHRSRELLMEVYGLEPGRIVLTPNATDGKYRPMTSAELGDVGQRYTAGRPFVLHVSNFSERKNPWTILRAFERLSQDPALGDLMLVVVGNGWKENREVAEFLKQPGMAGRIVLTGFIPEGDLPRLFNLARLFVFPSLSEGFGMPNLEAMACGCPVITSDAFAIPEVTGGAAVILRNKLDPGELADAMARLLASSGEQGRLRELGLKRARDFSWDRSARVLLETYQELLQN